MRMAPAPSVRSPERITLPGRHGRPSVRTTHFPQGDARGENYPVGSGEVVTEGIDGRLGPTVRVNLAVEILDVAVRGAAADEERPGDLAVAHPSGDQPQHVHLTRR